MRNAPPGLLYYWTSALLADLCPSCLTTFHKYPLFLLLSFKGGSTSKWRFLLSRHLKHWQPSNLLKHTFALLLTKSLSIARQLCLSFITTAAHNFLIITLCSSHLLDAYLPKALSGKLCIFFLQSRTLFTYTETHSFIFILWTLLYYECNAEWQR